MKTCKTIFKSKTKIKFILYFLVAVLITGCSKDDGQPPLKEEVKLSSAKAITSFVFLLTNNPINVNVVGTIDEENKTITAEMPPGTTLSGLLPEVKISDLSTIDIDTAQDFNSPLEYTVTAEDGSTALYNVSVNALLTQRQILQTILDVNPDNILDWDLQNTENLGDLDGVSTNVEGLIIALELILKGLTTIPSEIGQLTNLKILELAHNKLSELPEEIGQLTNLETLNLIFNQLASIPSTIGHSTSLKFLRLNSNNLTTLPPEIGQLINLESLYLPNNRFNELPPEICQLTKLTYLTFEANDINAVPTEIKQLVNLEVLSFHSNKLTSLPPEITQLSNLTALLLGRNQLTSLPAEVGQLTSLRELYLNGNQLTVIPSQIGQLTNLTKLILDSNQLAEIPPEIGFLSQLEFLDIRNNDFDFIPRAVCYLEQFHDTEIIHSSSAFCGTPSGGESNALVSIYSSNPGNTLGWGVDNYPGVEFTEEGKVRTITTNNKNLERIPFDIVGLNFVEVLNLNGNSFTDFLALPTEISRLSTLTTLTLANTGINTVPSSFGNLSNLTLLSLSSNPITNIPSEVCDLQVSNGGILTILTDPGEGCD